MRRHARVRKHVSGTAERPRLAVYRSSKHIYAQLIDDVAGVTLASASTIQNDLKEAVGDSTKIEEAQIVGKSIGEKAGSLGITQAVFDRGGFRYHGRVKALADAARDAGLSLGETRERGEDGAEAKSA